MQFSTTTLILAVAAAASLISDSQGFVVRPSTTATTTPSALTSWQPAAPLLATTEESSKASESAFVPLDDASAASSTDDEDEQEQDDDTLAKAESLGRGAAKKKRGRRKGARGVSSGSKKKLTKAALAPEETFYEGPPAKSETVLPTVSILTVIGIVPAAAAWARQAWVRYKITSRRIRVTSGIGGKEMSEIVYPDIIEIRTAKRLFGDGDMVAFLRDGAKFELRSIPNFDDTMEFILNQVDPDVAKAYREKGDVTEG